METIVDYQIVDNWDGPADTYGDRNFFAARVRGLLADGWQPVGGVTILMDRMIMQAMIKVQRV